MRCLYNSRTDSESSDWSFVILSDNINKTLFICKFVAWRHCLTVHVRSQISINLFKSIGLVVRNWRWRDLKTLKRVPSKTLVIGFLSNTRINNVLLKTTIYCITYSHVSRDFENRKKWYVDSHGQDITASPVRQYPRDDIGSLICRWVGLFVACRMPTSCRPTGHDHIHPDQCIHRIQPVFVSIPAKLAVFVRGIWLCSAMTKQISPRLR